MVNAALSSGQLNNFDLKNQMVQLVSSGTAALKTVSLGELEAFRTRPSAIPASKYGLEVLCGASCETGAQ